jgi:leucyl aminopeptidase
MAIMFTQLSFAPLAGIETELLAVLAVDQQIDNEPEAKPRPILLTDDEAVHTAAASLLESSEFKAAANETLLLHAPAGLSARHLLIVGLGKQDKVAINTVRNAAGTAVRFAKPRGIRELVIALPVAEWIPDAICARAVIEGALLGDFDPDTYRSDYKDQSIQSLILAVSEVADAFKVGCAYAEGVIIGESQNFARFLANESGNKLTPTTLGQRVAAMASASGLGWEVYSTEKIRELKMGALLSVAQGSAEPPALIVLRYEPKNTKKGPMKEGPVLGLVGKGLTLDSVRISLKPGEKMEEMKTGMAGAAAVIGAMRAIALLKPWMRAIAVVCAVEKIADGKVQNPGDLMTSMPVDEKPGKTVEVINTDTEGRLVLAEGLTYARQLGATHLIDAATLTGASALALGHVYAGAFSNDDDTYERFNAGLAITGEKFWRLPLDEEYAEMIKSDIGDVKNTSGGWGGAITAAEFLKDFADETPWVHLEIAGMAWLEGARPYIAKGPSGVAMRSILEWAMSYEGICGKQEIEDETGYTDHTK